MKRNGMCRTPLVSRFKGESGRRLLFTCVVATCVLPAFAEAAEPQSEARRDVSPALGQTAREMQERKAAGVPGALEMHKEHKVRPIPLPKKKHAPAALLKAPAAAPHKLDASTIMQFEGIGRGLNPPYTVEHAPPDTNGSVGENEFVQWVNEAFAVFDKKTGAVIIAPTDGNALWKDFGGNCEHFNDGDPITLYDKTAQRWLMTQFAVSNGPPFSQCIAVSKTSDPLGEYFRYEFQFQDFNDYPKFGVWPDAYYASFNMFRGNSFVGAKACAFDRAKMLAGAAATMQCFDATDFGGLLPADVDGGPPPPAGSPNYFLNFGDNELNLWRFKVDWSNPANSQFSGPITIPVTAFTPACATCVPQPKTRQRLDTLADRLMYRLSYRNFGDHESLAVNHTVSTGKSIGVRWYEIQDPQGTPQVKQQGTLAPNSLYRWMGSIAMDKMGNMLLGYSAASNRTYPAIRYAGRNVTDAAGLMSVEVKATSGKGSQGTTLERWGDYSSISLDPADDCTFWFTTQYLGESGTFNWRTRIISIRFNNCASQ